MWRRRRERRRDAPLGLRRAADRLRRRFRGGRVRHAAMAGRRRRERRNQSGGAAHRDRQAPPAALAGGRGIHLRARPRDAPAEGDAAESADARDALVAGTFGGGISRAVRAFRRRRRYPARRGGRIGEPGMRIYPDRRAGTGHAGRSVDARARLRGAWHLDRADARRGRRDAQRARGRVRRHLRTCICAAATTPVIG